MKPMSIVAVLPYSYSHTKNNFAEDNGGPLSSLRLQQTFWPTNIDFKTNGDLEKCDFEVTSVFN